MASPIYVESPVPRPLPFGLLSVADERPGGNGHWQQGVQYPSDNCVVTMATPTGDFCTTSDPKVVVDDSGTTDAAPFTAYVLRECGTVGDVAQAHDRAMRMFNASEGIAVERGFWAYLADPTTTVVDITGAQTVDSPALGLAMLEEYAAEHYGGIPTIHVDRLVGSLLGTSRSIERHGNRLETVQGAYVASGGGYGPAGPDGGSPGPDEAWMGVTGVVTLWRGAAHVHGPFVQMDPSLAYLNTTVVLAERTYVVSPDCLVAAVRVKL
jgi:hypothetical protein